MIFKTMLPLLSIVILLMASIDGKPYLFDHNKLPHESTFSTKLSYSELPVPISSPPITEPQSPDIAKDLLNSLLPRCTGRTLFSASDDDQWTPSIQSLETNLADL
jgi:hypothetical protein